MGFSLHHRADVRDDIVRVMSERVAKAQDALDGADDDPTDAIHECRKRCKQVRGAIRLVRPAIDDDGDGDGDGGGYQRVNQLARDAARPLADYRDAAAMAQTFDRLTDRLAEHGVAPDAATSVAGVLDTRRAASEGRSDQLADDIARSRSLLHELDETIESLDLATDGWGALGPGLAKTYDRGRSAMEDAIDGPTGPRFHEWRKRAKYTRYHLDLLAPSAPTVLEPLGTAFHDLTDALGDAHDLVVLGAWLRSDEAAELVDDDLTPVRVAIDGARAELEHRAVDLGRRLYVESPKRFAHRLGAYWQAWTEEEARQPAGGIDEVLT
jgi:CHAD domain-containing protein